MIDPERLCKNCFSRLDEPQGVCPHCGFDNAACENAANQLECGSILWGKFLVGRSLGQGGFGITYAGFNLNLKLKVAIKEYFPGNFVVRDGRTRSEVLPRPGHESFFEKGKEKFLVEAQTLALFSDDPCIVNVLDFFTENGTAYIVMSFVEGETLRAYADRRRGKLPSGEVLSIMRPLFTSLMRVHEKNLLHRDISPDNIMRRADGSLVLIDFGAAREFSSMGEHANTVFLKHGYAPEEQYRTHGKQGAWTDVYALCATIYRLTTGKTPPPAFDRLRNDVPLLPPNALGADFSSAEQAAILHGLAVYADERTRTIQQLQDELRQLPDFSKPTTQIDIVYEPVTDTKPERYPQTEKKTKAEEVREFEGPIALAGKDEPQAVKKKGAQTPAWWRSKYAIAGMIAVVVLAVALPLLFSQIGTKGGDETATKASGATAAEVLAQTQDPAAVTQAPAEPTAEANPLPEPGEVLYGYLAAGTQYSAALNFDGTVNVYGGENSQIYASGWSDIVQIAGYGDLLVGLCSDGSVVATGTDTQHLSGEYLGWSDIQSIEAGYQSVIALSQDGYVLYDGTTYQNLNACENWQNIAVLVRGDEHMVGVTTSGTLLGVGMDNVGQRDVSGISNVLNAATSCQTTYILKRDGTLQLVGGNPEYEQGQANAANWSDIIAITSGDRHVIGLKRDGTVVSAGDNSYGQCNVGKWTNLVAICAGHSHTIALDSDGVLHMTGSNKYGQTTGDGDSILLH